MLGEDDPPARPARQINAVGPGCGCRSDGDMQPPVNEHSQGLSGATWNVLEQQHRPGGGRQPEEGDDEVGQGQFAGIGVQQDRRHGHQARDRIPPGLLLNSHRLEQGIDPDPSGQGGQLGLPVDHLEEVRRHPQVEVAKLPVPANPDVMGNGGSTVLSKRSTLDYVYVSDIETPSATLPGAYSTAVIPGTAKTGQQVATELCSRYWYAAGPVNPTTSGNQRNLNFCGWAGIYSFEKLVGQLHSNDIWRLENANLTGTLDAGAITSSCRSAAEGLTAGEVGCAELHRYVVVANGGGNLNTNNGNNATWRDYPTCQLTSGCSGTWSGGLWYTWADGRYWGPTTYQGNAYRPAAPADITGRNPRYDSVLEFPKSTALLKKQASETGCVFTGPTRIRFAMENGLSYLYVTSPDTIITAAACGGSALRSPPTAQVTLRIALAGFTDLVIYVQNVPRAGQVDDPDNAWDVNNRWASNAEPTCKIKGTKTYPYVIPNDVVDRSYFNSGSTYKGFPSELADAASPWYSLSCSNGDLWAQGQYQGNLTIATESNIVLTSSLADATASAATGQPAAASQSALGLASEKFTYLYRPMTAARAWVADWKQSNALNPKFNFALIVVDQCFATQDPYYAPSNGDIYLWGSLAQKYRCVVGSTGGYAKRYSYDVRLARITPPYLLQLSTEPWEVQRYAEVSVVDQVVGPQQYTLLAADDVGATIQNANVTFGSASVVVAGSRATVTATGPGMVVVTYDVVTAAVTQPRRLVIMVQ